MTFLTLLTAGIIIGFFIAMVVGCVYAIKADRKYPKK